MKTRFTTVDIVAIINELKQYIGYRAIKVYDIDSKTFLIKLSKTGEEGKTTLLIESGTRIHITEFEWPKNPTPSGMSMKLRKHIKNRRLTNVSQVGLDRVVDLQFGSNECASHFIAELYDRGNLILTDFEYTILHLGRTRVDNVEYKLIVKERYPIEAASITDYISNEEMFKSKLQASISEAKPSDNIRKIALTLFIYGPNLLEHCLSKIGFTLNTKLSQALKNSSESELIEKLYQTMVDAQEYMTDLQSMTCKGYIYGQRKEGDVDGEVAIFEDFHPVLFNQMANKPYKEFSSFNVAVDIFFSSIGAQKTEQQISQKEKAAMKKLENIKSDHEKRLKELQETQQLDKLKGELIESNLDLVNNIIFTLNHAIANQVVWEDIKDLIKEGQKNKDSLVSCISSINLECNKVILKLQDPYKYDGYDYDDDADEGANEVAETWVETEIDLSINAYSNARRYFTMKKAAGSKEQKTLSASSKAMKSAEIKTKQMLNEVQTVARINKARKVHWFEKFNWFISSENYLVVGGKDQSQNEVLVKRYLGPGDVYVHADVHGASTVVVRNHRYPQYREIPPKTLNEAGNMAVVYSGAWISKISSAAWWVYQDQVSKTAPSGEYLTTGSFMIRGKKNYLPLVPLTFGFGIMFRLSGESMLNHIDERKVRGDIEELGDGHIVEEFDEIMSEESDSEFPNTRINKEELESAKVNIEESKEEISVTEDVSERHKYVSARERRNKKKCVGDSKNDGCESVIKEEVDGETLNSDDERGEKVDADVTEDVYEKEDIKNQEEDNEEEEEFDEVIKEEQGDEEVNVAKIEEQLDKLTLECVKDESKESMKKMTEIGKISGGSVSGSTASLIKNQGPLKRRQANKLKKIKDRYKDQDEEERGLKIAILHGKNPYQDSEDLKPMTKKEKRKRDEEAKKKLAEEKLLKQQAPKGRNMPQKERQPPKNEKIEQVEDWEEDEENIGAPGGAVQWETEMNSLTGMPLPEDELMYALPVCAPYQTLQNYKFKVKMLPGTTKRGKAGKSVLFNFTMDRSIGTHEKELVKAMKDQDITRNFPGTVKIYTPNVNKNSMKKAARQ